MKPPGKPRILYLIFGPGPSEMVRGRVFAPAIQSAGYQVDFFQVYSPVAEALVGIPGLRLVGRVLRRLLGGAHERHALSIARRYERVVVVKWATPAFMRRLKQSTSAKVLYDFDDAMWLDAFIGEEAFTALVSLADVVSCDNSILAERTRRINPHVFVLDGPAQVELFDAHRRKQPRDVVTIGWVGSPHTMFYLGEVAEALEAVGRRFPNVELVLLGTGTDEERIPAFDKIRARTIPLYDQAEMVRVVSEFDIGLFPLRDDEMSLGRGALKARVYMAAGVPVIASRLGENIRLIREGETGFLASTTQDWVSAMTRLIEDPALRRRVGSRGQAVMREQFTVERCFRQLEKGFLSAPA